MNRLIVNGAFEMVVGKEGISKLCEMLKMPFSMSCSTQYDHEEVLSKAHEEVIQEQLTLNKAEARKQAIEEGNADGQTVNSIPVSHDG